MKKIDIKSNLYDYSVEFVDSFQNKLNEFGSNTVYVIDENVYHLYQTNFMKIDTDRIFFIKPKEKYKNMETVLEIIAYWKKIGVKKDWKVICFGGGISQDLATIASNLYLRNIEWYFFPTTLLSMCDSCIGGKCGINLGQFKNQIGVFYPPKKIFIDEAFLNTLTEEDYINGWGELLKFSLTLKNSFYDDIKKEHKFIPCENIAKHIEMGLRVKQIIIEQDEFESDLRRVLNYGHTYGHALEAYTSNRIPHGTAVIWGIDVVNYISWKKGLIDEELYLDVKKLIKTEFIKQEIVIDKPDELFDMIKTDKKVKGNTLSFALLDSDRKLIVYPIAIDQELEDLFVEYVEETHEYYSN